MLLRAWKWDLWHLRPSCIEVKFHDEVMTWECFPHYWPFVRGIHQSLVDCPHKGSVIKGNTFHITDPLWGESTSDWWIALTKGQWFREFKLLFVESLNRLLNKQSSCQWLKIPWCMPHDLTVMLQIDWWFSQIQLYDAENRIRVRQSTLIIMYIHHLSYWEEPSPSWLSNHSWFKI